MATAENRGAIKIVMLPWLAHGHITPFFELAKRLTKKDFQIYICSSPVNLQSIKPKLTKSDHKIQLIDLQIPPSPELPAHLHTTKGIPLRLVPALVRASDAAAPAFEGLLDELEPDLVVTDLFQPWAVRSAVARNIPIVNFIATGVALLTRLARACFNGADDEFPFPELDLSDHWISKNRRKSSESEERGRDIAMRSFNCLKQSSPIFLANTFVEIEGKYIDYLTSSFNKKILPIAPLVRPIDADDGKDKHEILSWLDKKNPKSTVYVSFGSEFYLTKSDREELAHGLEQSGANFIWVLRFPKDETTTIEDSLPKGFLSRVRDRVVIVDGWAPQLEILSHPSVGAFVCHCGWNSVVESVLYGMPMVALPMQFDQPWNAVLAAAAGVGVEAERDGEGSVKREEVARAVREVVFGKKGELLRERAGEIGDALREREWENIDIVAEEFRKLCEDKKGNLM